MSLPENDFQILKLTDAFYEAHPNAIFKEIMIKRKRAYTCLLFQTHYDFFICIPFRTEIMHDNAYHFKDSARSKKHRSGLDYSKIIIIRNLDYLGNKDALIDKDEFNELMKNLNKIKREALQFVEDYVNHLEGRKKLHEAEFKRRYQFTTLQYFHDELKIEKSL